MRFSAPGILVLLPCYNGEYSRNDRESPTEIFGKEKICMYMPLPQTSEAFACLSWPEIEPWYRELQETALSHETLQPWLSRCSCLSELVDEIMAANEIACMRDTADQEAERRQQRFLDEVYTHVQFYEQELKEQLLASTLSPEDFAIPLRNLRTEAALFCEANMPLLNEEKRLTGEYFQTVWNQTVTWEGKEVWVGALGPVLAEPDRERREHAWRTLSTRQLADRPVLNEQ